ncbi:NAD(P)-dependent alcohol dehydrogenase [soil metagenome]
MKAARIHDFGGPEAIRIEEVERPRPKERQILIKVGASSLNHIDLSLRSGEMKVLTRFQLPKTLGFDLAGEVVECGVGVTSFLPGDRVAGMTGLGAGAAADFCCIEQNQATLVPGGVAWAEAAALPLAGATALQCLRGLAHLRAGQRVLINGASGCVGGFGVQLAKLFGAHVTAVCRECHFGHVRALGADATLDYQRDSLTDPGERYDVVFDAAATLEIGQLKALVHHGGHFVTTRPEPKQVVEGLIERFRGGVQMHFVLTRSRPGDFAFLLRLLEDGRLKPCVAQTFALAECADAHRYLESESMAGKVVLVP